MNQSGPIKSGGVSMVCKKASALAFVSAIAVLFVCAADAQDKNTALGAEITSIEAQIKEAEAENAKYAGGLVKSLIVARLEILRQTHAMLQQRAKAQKSLSEE